MPGSLCLLCISVLNVGAVVQRTEGNLKLTRCLLQPLLGQHLGNLKGGEGLFWIITVGGCRQHDAGVVVARAALAVVAGP